MSKTKSKAQKYWKMGNVYYGTPPYEPRKWCQFYDNIANDCIALKCLCCAYEKAPCNFYKRKESKKNDN